MIGRGVYSSPLSTAQCRGTSTSWDNPQIHHTVDTVRVQRRLTSPKPRIPSPSSPACHQVAVPVNPSTNLGLGIMRTPPPGIPTQTRKGGDTDYACIGGLQRSMIKSDERHGTPSSKPRSASAKGPPSDVRSICRRIPLLHNRVAASPTQGRISNAPRDMVMLQSL